MDAARLVCAVEIRAAARAGQDRAVVIERPDGVVIALADGAGGTGAGAESAQAVIDAVVRAAAVAAPAAPKNGCSGTPNERTRSNEERTSGCLRGLRGHRESGLNL